MKKDKIFLLGFMGCGKSTFGKKLASKLNWNFIDLDDYIEEKEGERIVDIFKHRGEAYFRGLETKAVEATAKMKRTIISTGGGTPCFNNNIESINSLGLSVYIKLSPTVLKKRLLNETNKRPLLSGFNEDELLTFIVSKLAEREDDYLKSEIIFNFNEDAVPNFIEKIKEVV